MKPQDLKGRVMTDKFEELAARILDGLSDRKGVGNELDATDSDILAEIREEIAETIRSSVGTSPPSPKQRPKVVQVLLVQGIDGWNDELLYRLDDGAVWAKELTSGCWRELKLPPPCIAEPEGAE